MPEARHRGRGNRLDLARVAGDVYLYTGHASLSNERDAEAQVDVVEGSSLGLHQFMIIAEAVLQGRKKFSNEMIVLGLRLPRST